MDAFEPRDADFRRRVTKSFDLQPFANHIGGTLERVDPGEVDIALKYKPELAQQTWLCTWRCHYLDRRCGGRICSYDIGGAQRWRADNRA